MQYGCMLVLEDKQQQQQYEPIISVLLDIEMLY